MNEQTFQQLHQRLADVNAKLNELRELVEQDRSSTVFRKQELQKLETQRKSIEDQLDDLHGRLTWERYELVNLENSLYSLEMEVSRALQVFE